MTAAPESAIARKVEHVMGLPISLALRGRHTDDTAANDAWHAVLAELGRIDAVFSRYRPDTVISRLGRGEPTEAQYPAEVHEVPRSPPPPNARPAARSPSAAPTPRGTRCSTPTAS